MRSKQPRSWLKWQRITNAKKRAKYIDHYKKYYVKMLQTDSIADMERYLETISEMTFVLKFIFELDAEQIDVIQASCWEAYDNGEHKRL